MVAPNGIGTEAWWKATKAGTSGIGRITHFDPSSTRRQLAGEVEDFDADDYIEKRLMVQTDRWTHMALAATQMALGRRGVRPGGAGPVLDERDHRSSSSGGNEFGQKEIQALWEQGPGFVGAYQSIAWFYAATTGQISIRHGMKGPCGVVVVRGRRRPGGAPALAAHDPPRRRARSSAAGSRRRSARTP